MTWKYRDTNGLSHRVTFSRDRDEITSENLSYGQTFAHSFTNKGTYIYHCDLQGQIAMGKVIVI